MKHFIPVLVIFFALPAFSVVEVRLHTGAVSGKPGTFNDNRENSIAGYPDVLSSLPMSGVDLLFVLPNPVTVGVRYEMFHVRDSAKAKTANTNTEIELKGSRASLLGGYRFINTADHYVGVLAHVGLMQSMDFTEIVKAANTTTTSYKGKVGQTFGVAGEAGLKLGFFCWARSLATRC